MKTFEESLSQSSKQLVKDRLAVSDREMYFYEMGYRDAWEVTHADYRALEEELAALRGKVGELVESRDHLYTVETSLASDEEQIKASDRFQTALRGMK